MLAMLVVLIIKQYARNYVFDSCHFAVLQIWTSKLHTLWAEDMSCNRTIGLFPHQLRSPTQLLLKPDPPDAQHANRHGSVAQAQASACGPQCKSHGKLELDLVRQAIGSQSRGNQFAAMVAALGPVCEGCGEDVPIVCPSGYCAPCCEMEDV